MAKPVITLISCLLGLTACNPGPTAQQASGLPSAGPAASVTPGFQSVTPGSQSGTSSSSPLPSPLYPSPSAPPALPGSLPAGLAGLRLETGNRFLSGQGARAQFRAVLLDAAGQVLRAEVPLQWQSSRPQDFSVDDQGQILALVGSGYADIQVRIPGTAFAASAVMNVSSFGRSGSSGGSALFPPNLSGLAGAPLSGGKPVLIREQILTLEGSGFQPDSTRNQVLFGSISATPLTASANQLTVSVPLSVNQAGDVVIRVVTDNLSSNTLTGTVLSEPLILNNGGFF
jgi:hypothetical protein